jgi:hypothetical protein
MALLAFDFGVLVLERGASATSTPRSLAEPQNRHVDM